MLLREVRKVYAKVIPETEGIRYYLPRLLEGCASILDFGCGKNSPAAVLKDCYRVGIEVYRPYIDIALQQGTHNKIIQGDILEVPLEDKSFDAAIALDVIEHLTREQGYNLIKRMEKVARKKILILTPNGFFHQEGYDENSHQEHKSGWSIEDFEENGYKIYGCYGDKKHRGLLAGISEPMYKRLLADLSQKSVFHDPRRAFSIIAVKTID